MSTTATKAKPIIFTGESVRAILGGSKTQTRRVMDWPSEYNAPIAVEIGHPEVADKHGELGPGDPVFAAWWEDHHIKCPHPPGSVLWVKERYSPCVCDACKAAWPSKGPHKPTYEVDHAGSSGVLFRNRMFMPRWASRLSIEITGVKVERVQDISIADCHAEGVEPTWNTRMEDDIFAERWDAINGKKHPWSSNPWCWCYEFRKV